MKNKTYLITITSWNEKKKVYDQQVFEDDKQGITRIIMTFKPKKNYEVVNMIIDVIFKEDEYYKTDVNQLKFDL